MAQLYKITPLEKKSIEFVIECYQKLEDGDTRGFTATFLYRWGQGFRELDNPVSRWEADSDDGISCDPTIGWGAELEDSISIWVDFDGDWTDEEREEVEAYCEGELEDDEGRCCEAWLFDGDHEYEIEMDEIVIHGPVKIDLVDEDNYNTVIEENIEPQE